MADNRKYYYLKLKESYFDDDAMSITSGWRNCKQRTATTPSP